MYRYHWLSLRCNSLLPATSLPPPPLLALYCPTWKLWTDIPCCGSEFLEKSGRQHQSMPLAAQPVALQLKLWLSVYALLMIR